MNRSSIGLLAAIIALSTPIIYLEMHPKYFATVSLAPNIKPSVTLQLTQAFVRVDGYGRAFFQFRASSLNSKNEQLALGIRPDSEPNFYQQKNCCSSDANGTISGIAQLGVSEYPLHQDEQYDFQLSDSSDPKTTILDGKIIVVVYRLMDSERWIILAIGIVASMIHIVDWVWRLARPWRLGE